MARVGNNYKALLAWLKWNKAGRQGCFNNSLVREVEVDITTKCSGLPSCSDQCTYRHAKGLGQEIDLDLADRNFAQLQDLNMRRMIFSGGGEPLEATGFMAFVGAAARHGFEIELLTNGKFLTADLLPELFPHLAILRVSIPPVLRGYSHLKTIAEQLEAAVAQKGKTEVSASLLIRPDTPEAEIELDIAVLSDLGVDAIRFKPTHFWRETNDLYLDAMAYQDIVRFIAAIGHPLVRISKVDRLISVPRLEYPFCYWADFNPFVIGADGKNYACCETKYRPEYQRGDFEIQTAEQILELVARRPQNIMARCFAGCKGDLANRYLQALILGHDLLGDDVFENLHYKTLADAALTALVRSHPRN